MFDVEHSPSPTPRKTWDDDDAGSGGSWSIAVVIALIFIMFGILRAFRQLYFRKYFPELLEKSQVSGNIPMRTSSEEAIHI